MSQQGGGPTRQDDDWWGQLYDEAADDTGPTPVPDSLDDRYASVKRATTRETRPPDRTEDGGAGSGEPPGPPPLPARRARGQDRIAEDPPREEHPPFPAQRTGERAP
ncbi:hypothetical protein GTW73_02140, partial [Streptomyces sp. SID4982]|nr:hypothetical protein [Streptomyces sp. SID4982]